MIENVFPRALPSTEYTSFGMDSSERYVSIQAVMTSRETLSFPSVLILTTVGSGIELN